MDCCGERLQNVTIRAGLLRLAQNFRGVISINEQCGLFEGPGQNGKQYTINCSSSIAAKYVTVQIVGSRSILQINEIDIF